MTDLALSWWDACRLRSRLKTLELDRLGWQNRAIEAEEDHQRCRRLLREAAPYVKGGPLRDAIMRELRRG